ncbi:hypothetical protein [Paenibacillus sp. PL2-23]|uniref:hypothetical protein n=1 Tax=Paenibacillus sp. PL2-23 TaxID=2100729 RepID=UPI0030FBB85B
MKKGKHDKKYGMDINAIRQYALCQEFERNVGQRAFILISAYPFMIIGTIVRVHSDFVFIETEVTNIAELDNELFRLHIDQIAVFYIEDGNCRIPEFREQSC